MSNKGRKPNRLGSNTNCKGKKIEMIFKFQGLSDRSMCHSALVGFKEYQEGYRWIPGETHLKYADSLLKRINYLKRDDVRAVAMNQIEASVLIEALDRLSTRVSYVEEVENITDLIRRLRLMLNS